MIAMINQLNIIGINLFKIFYLRVINLPMMKLVSIYN